MGYLSRFVFLEAAARHGLLRATTRYGITAIGYGPGAVDTNIRREIPAVLRAVLRPVFAFATRTPDQVAAQLVELLADPALGGPSA